MLTPGQMLESQITRGLRRGYLTNVDLSPTPPAILEPHERCIARIRTRDNACIYLTDTRIVYGRESNPTSLYYSAVQNVHWISDTASLEHRSKLKSAQFDRLIFDTTNGEQIVLDRLDQAAFTLIGFFNWLKRRGLGIRD